MPQQMDMPRCTLTDLSGRGLSALAAYALMQVKATVRGSAQATNGSRRGRYRDRLRPHLHGGTQMSGSMDGMLRGWVMLWNMELTWLLAATVLAAAAGALVEIVAAIRERRR